MVLAILQQLGITLPTPQELAGIPGPPPQPGAPPGQPPGPPGMAPHGGPATTAQPINKHQLAQDAGKTTIQ
jgi:hypothetical protein